VEKMASCMNLLYAGVRAKQTKYPNLGYSGFPANLPILKKIHTDEQAVLRNLLKELRTQAGLTQEELAGRLSVPQSFVSKYESGERRLDVLELRQVCRALDCSLSDLVRKLEGELA
jgi:DNA-binding XRE family transcriptional regulator